MKKRLPTLLGVGIVFILAVGIYWHNNSENQSSWLGFEPRSAGQPLSYWLTNMSRYDYPQGRIINVSSKDAVLQIGTAALPLLLDWIAVPLSSAPGIQYQQHALNDIGLTSDEYISDLGDNLSCTNPFMVQAAEETLAKFAVHSKLAFVALIRKGVCGTIGRDDRQQAKWVLTSCSRDDPKFMLECLDDSDASIRMGALMIFHDLERSVPEAIPKLRELSTSDPDASVRSWAAGVLKLQLH